MYTEPVLSDAMLNQVIHQDFRKIEAHREMSCESITTFDVFAAVLPNLALPVQKSK